MANILIVEDNDSLKLAYSSFLAQEGHQIATASSVDEALVYLKDHTPDLLLVDMLMPGKNGLELLQNYDLRNEHKNVKAIAFSNLSEERIQEEALSLGANLYLTKSLTGPKELVDTIAGVLAAA